MYGVILNDCKHYQLWLVILFLIQNSISNNRSKSPRTLHPTPQQKEEEETQGK